MSEEKQIDWSKAPEWASVLLQNRLDEHCFAWAEAYEEGARFYRDDLQRVCDYLKVSWWNVLSTRPATWNGDGLPPVGTVCEVWYDDGRVSWHEGEVIHHKSDDPRYAAVRLRGEHHDKLVWIDSFRPIPTPEQIAAEERNAAINQMIGFVKDHPGGRHGAHHLAQLRIQEEACRDLYDAGYRRIEVKE